MLSIEHTQLLAQSENFETEIVARTEKGTEKDKKTNGIRDPGLGFISLIHSDADLKRLIFHDYGILHTAIADFVLHYQAKRNHQGVGNRLVLPGEAVGGKSGQIACRERLGQLLRYYSREAA